MKKILTILIAMVVLASLSAAVEGSTTVRQSGDQSITNAQDTAPIQVILTGNFQEARVLAVETGDNTVAAGSITGNDDQRERGCSEEMYVEQENIQDIENTQNTATTIQVIVAVNAQREDATTVMTGENTLAGGDIAGNTAVRTCATPPEPDR